VNRAGGSDVGNEADEAKARGNEAFKKQKWSAAVYHYSIAIDLPVPHYRLLDEGPRCVDNVAECFFTLPAPDCLPMHVPPHPPPSQSICSRSFISPFIWMN
jgi:hypothetical protein